MLLRQALGLMLCFTVTNLAVTGNSVPCPDHDGHEQAQAHASMPGMHHGPLTDHSSDAPYDDALAKVDCCQAVMSFAMGETRNEESMPARGMLPRLVERVPLSRVVAPETPPPKP